MRVLNGQRAVSPVFSVLLLVLITFSVGIFLYNFVMGTMGNVTEPPTAQPFSLFIEHVSINNTCITVHIRNSYNKDVTIDRAYVNKEPRDILPLNSKVVIPKNSTGEVYIPGSYNKGALYEVKIISTSGNTLLSIQRY
jgi:flagellin-like protein